MGLPRDAGNVALLLLTSSSSSSNSGVWARLRVGTLVATPGVPLLGTAGEAPALTGAVKGRPASSEPAGLSSNSVRSGGVRVRVMGGGPVSGRAVGLPALVSIERGSNSAETDSSAAG